MKTEDIEYHADGALLVGYLAVDDSRSGKRPGVLVALTKAIARRLSEAGYVAFAMDYYGDGKPLADRNEVMPRVNAFMADPGPGRGRPGNFGQPTGMRRQQARGDRLLLWRHDSA